ncbi:DUF1566 domain-containing protein [Desulforhopalus sp. IMCC35007]|uniref:Lcl C-terminal domain-containing protein n=1 Tax=Desulforhopalus sp. IMCC35007 TaxID=2569543 RepID=UPI0010AE50EA|nr:DUF1566 domain-containing protein [Desulforhopalus sp. IMCC35007]TKB08183.1 DUF1566 domain-containing protein [Desulforhopalus sp. IMCC35007]
MGMFHKVTVGDQIISPIDWEMDPALAFGTFESWGGRERVRNNDECVYYFFVDNWGDVPKLCLMERAVKHARIMAEIKAPLEIIQDCVKGQGTSSIFEKSYAINDKIKQWLIDNVLDKGESKLVIPEVVEEHVEDMGAQLPDMGCSNYSGEVVALPSDSAVINDDDIVPLIKKWNFFDRELNPSGRFDNALVSTADDEVVVDLRTNLMWQSGGIDIGSIRHVHRQIVETNKNQFGGHADWRLPTMEEAMSLLEPLKNDKGVYLNPCFSKEQPFIFVDNQRKPGGYWFVDFKQGRAFWSSGTIPGGFGRLVRSVK